MLPSEAAKIGVKKCCVGFGEGCRWRGRLGQGTRVGVVGITYGENDRLGRWHRGSYNGEALFRGSWRRLPSAAH